MPISLREIYSGKKVLVTGHTGFKGSWLTAWLRCLDAKVVGVSLSELEKPSNFEVSDVKDLLLKDYRVDIQDARAVNEIVLEEAPDFIFHLAAQALVRNSYESPLETIRINGLGTANVLDCLRTQPKPVVAVMITSDKAYDNVEWVWGYRESDRIGGKDPYSASKGVAELVIRSYVTSFFSAQDTNVRIGIARAGNVIGGGDWAADRIVPDSVRAWSKNRSVEIRNPSATRPWQHVLEPLSGYLVLAGKLSMHSELHGEAYNFGPPAHADYTVSQLINKMGEHWDSVLWKDTSDRTPDFHEAGLLKLNCDKALRDIQWRSTLQFSETVRMTTEWYKKYYQAESDSMQEFTLAQIQEYAELADRRDRCWTM